ncbi:MAG: PAS domain S-box protein [Sulfuricella sp.]|nr:PAS domain S-box protein [Sulfuricella sp.]
MIRFSQFLRETSFSRQLSIVVAMAVLSLAFASSLATSWQSSNLIRANLLEQGQRIAENLARQSKLALLYDSEDNANEAVSVTLNFPDVIALEIRHADGRLLLWRGDKEVPRGPPAQPALPQQGAVLEAENGDSWHFIAPVLAGSSKDASPFEVSEPTQEALGYVRVTQSKKTLTRMRADVFAVNFAVSFFFAFVFLLIVRNLTTRLSRPLERLSAAMARAEAGASEVRAEPSGPKDIVDMAHAFNKMMVSLEASKRDLQTLLDNLPAALIVHDADTAILYANPVAKTFFGLEDEQLIGRTESDPNWHFIRADGSVMPPEEHPVNRVAADRLPLHDYTVGIQTAGAEPRWASVSAFPETDRRGNLEQIIVCLVDITERKQYELALERDAQEWTQAMDAFSDIIYLLDTKRNLLRANKMFFASTGCNPDQVIGQSIVGLIHSIGEAENCPVCRAQEEKRDALITMEADHPANSTRRPVEVTVKIIRDQAGQPQSILTGIHDLTNTRKIENELRLLNESLEHRVLEEVAKNHDKDSLLIQQSRNATMGEMMHNVAHQWRQPLNALNLILQNIKDAYEYNDLTQENLDTLVNDGNRVAQKMSTTIDDFRNFFKPDQRKTRFNLRDSIREALNLVEAGFQNNHIEVVLETPEDIFVQGFHGEYSQVLLNVLVNAKDAIRAQNRPGKLVIHLENHDGQGVVRVTDNGGGIPEQVLPKVFDPYFTTKESGSGIGLYMSRMIMSHMKGNISARNIGGGAEITVSVPIVSEEQ